MRPDRVTIGRSPIWRDCTSIEWDRRHSLWSVKRSLADAPRQREASSVPDPFLPVVSARRAERQEATGAHGAPNFGITLSANRRRLSREPWPNNRT